MKNKLFTIGLSLVLAVSFFIEKTGRKYILTNREMSVEQRIHNN